MGTGARTKWQPEPRSGGTLRACTCKIKVFMYQFMGKLPRFRKAGRFSTHWKTGLCTFTRARFEEYPSDQIATRTGISALARIQLVTITPRTWISGKPFAPGRAGLGGFSETGEPPSDPHPGDSRTAPHHHEPVQWPRRWRYPVRYPILPG